MAVAGEQELPPDIANGTPLVGQEEPSIPPCEALDICGSDFARDLFAAVGSREAAGTYDVEYRRTCPLFRDDMYAVLGGWHAFWPEMDAFDEQPGRLVLWTFGDAEPWVEVWLEDSGELKAVPRTT